MVGIALVFIVGIIAVAATVSRSKDKFRFEVTPAKLCGGGMWKLGSKDSHLYKMCSKMDPEYIAQYNCGAGFIGRPVKWSYTPESDDLWGNPRCSSPLNANDPCPL